MLEERFFYYAIFFYAVASAAFVIAYAFKKQKAYTYGNVLSGCGLSVQSLSLISRWINIGHGPYLTRYEVLSSDAYVLILFFLLSQIVYRKIRLTGCILLPVSLILMGFASNMPRDSLNLPATFQNYWLVVHIFFAKLAYGSILIATALSIFYLRKERKQPLSEKEVLDELSYKFVTAGFLFLAIMIIAGSIWAYKSWGRYWGFDPIETWALFTWLTYGIYLHLRRTLLWKGHRSATYLIIAVVFITAAYFGVPYITKSIHSTYFSR